MSNAYMLLQKRLLLVGTIAAFGLAGCSGSGTSPKSVTQASLASNVMQLSVGTANLYGDVPASAITGLNVVATYRQPAGSVLPGGSATLVNAPTLTGPFVVPGPSGTADSFNSTVQTGAATGEIGGHSFTSTLQGLAGVTSLGVDGGVFGYGIEPYNYTNSGIPSNITPYNVPLLSDPTVNLNTFIPWGGPPAFDANHDGQGTRDGHGYPKGGGPAGDQNTDGIPEGLDVFAHVVPVAGSYSLNVSIQANTGTVTQAATATMASVALLPAVAPAVPAVAATGGATFAVVLPAGLREAYIQVEDIGPATGTSCNGASAEPVFYTLFVTASGTATLPATDGPLGAPSLCTSAQNTAAAANAGVTTDGDQFTVQTIGFDYPAYESSYPNSSGNPAPVIIGTGGQSDITVSSQALWAQPAGGALTRLSSTARRTQTKR
jgi:hypothetical protein